MKLFRRGRQEPEPSGDPPELPRAQQMFDLQGLALAAVTRPADVLAAIGWQGPVNTGREIGWFSAILRSCWQFSWD